MKREILRILEKADKICISSHVRPDADSIGSGLALYLMLKQIGKKVKYYNTDWAPFPTNQLPHYEYIEYKQIYPEKFDLLFLIEGGTEKRTGQKNLEEYFSINIDHHSTSSRNSNLNWIVPNASAVGELIFELGKALKIEFTEEIGFNLYAAIASDTGSFKYSNTSAKSLRIASELIEMCRFTPHDVSLLLFNSNRVEKIQVIIKVLQTLELKLNQQVSIIEYRRNFLNDFSLLEIDTEDIISIARSIIGIRVTIFIKEIGDKIYRISLRSKGDVSSQAIAMHFGGGGHDHAAGFYYEGDIKEAKNQILEILKKQLS